MKQNVFESLDPKTGRPNVNPVRQPGTGKKADFCPSLWGGKDWPPVAYSPKTQLLYIPANENLCGTSIGSKVSYEPGERFVGADTTLYIAPGADHIGELQAWNLDTGKKVWSHPFTNRNSGVRYWRPGAVSSLWVAPTTAISAPSTPRTARYCGSSAPVRE